MQSHSRKTTGTVTPFDKYAVTVAKRLLCSHSCEATVTPFIKNVQSHNREATVTPHRREVAARYRYMEKDKTENLKINAGNFYKYTSG